MNDIIRRQIIKGLKKVRQDIISSEGSRIGSDKVWLKIVLQLSLELYPTTSTYNQDLARQSFVMACRGLKPG